jgi:hypothetical protein
VTNSFPYLNPRAPPSVLRRSLLPGARAPVTTGAIAQIISTYREVGGAEVSRSNLYVFNAPARCEIHGNKLCFSPGQHGSVSVAQGGRQAHHFRPRVSTRSGRGRSGDFNTPAGVSPSAGGGGGGIPSPLSAAVSTCFGFLFIVAARQVTTSLVR